MANKKANGVEFYQDWDRSEGAIVMVNPKTIKRYQALRNEQPKAEDYGVFFAFGDEQFEKGRQRLISQGYIKDGDKLCADDMGMYGTKDEIARYLKFYEERYKKIAEECDPQEVYFYEWNNHEAMFGDDDEAMKVVASIFGKERAHKIARVYPGTAVNVLLPLTERDQHLHDFEFELLMLGRLKFDYDGFASAGDCRYHRLDMLYGGNAKSFIEHIHKYFDKLPEDIRDASVISKDDVDRYAKELEDFTASYFASPEFDPIPHTPSSTYQGLEIPLGLNRLRYKDDDGKWQIPDTVWFSNDTRRWHQDAKCVAGRAFTSYLGKNGTTLARVYIDTDNLSMVPYSLPHLCDVSARYNPDYRENKLYGFYHE